MNPLGLFVVVLLVWVVLLMVWLVYLEVKVRALSDRLMRSDLQLRKTLAEESRERDRWIHYLDRYVKEVAHYTLPADVWVRVERDASRFLEER